MSRFVLIPVLVLGCRPELGKPSYPDLGSNNPTTTNEDFLPGDVPFQAGDERLFLSVFYEGQYTDEIVIDDVTRHYYIWEGTYTLDVSDDRIEGLVSDRVNIGSVGWWGGGIAYDAPEDLSEWTALHLCARSEEVPTFEVLVEWGGGSGSVFAAAYGFTNDGAWHCMTVPTTDFAGMDWTLVTTPLALTGIGLDGEQIQFDDVYYRKGAP